MIADSHKNNIPVLHPAGRLISAADLPPVAISRWTAMRKAEVVAGIRAGLISAEQACERYRLSEEELSSWKGYLDDHGVLGLRSNQVKKYRSQSDRDT